MTNIINVLTKNIIPDPEIPQFRGPIHNTVTLQESILIEGIQQPLWARLSPEDDTENEGLYFLIDGNRRLHAVRQLGIKEVPVLIKDVDAHGARCLALVANQTEKFPDIVLDKEGKVIGGNCLAAKLEVDRPNVRRYMVAEWMGVPSDVIGALYRLYSESVPVKRKVEKGHLAITVYSLFKTAPDDVKEYLAKRPGHVSANIVRRTLRNWEQIRARIEANPVDAREDAHLTVVSNELELVEEQPAVAFCLNKAIGWLQKVNGHVLEPTDWHLVKEIPKILDDIEHSYFRK